MRTGGTEGDDESGTSNIPVSKSYHPKLNTIFTANCMHAIVLITLLFITQIKKAGSQPAPESEEDNTAERKTWSPFSKPRNGVQGKCVLTCRAFVLYENEISLLYEHVHSAL